VAAIDRNAEYLTPQQVFEFVIDPLNCKQRAAECDKACITAATGSLPGFADVLVPAEMQGKAPTEAG
jgi:hypothetical protein